LRRFRLRAFDRGDHSLDRERRVENTDALAASGSRGGTSPEQGMSHATGPPAYVEPDDGRPPH
jgi:hypothetical protein